MRTGSCGEKNGRCTEKGRKRAALAEVPHEPLSGCGLLEFVQRIGGVIHIHQIPDPGVIDDSEQGAVAGR